MDFFTTRSFIRCLVVTRCEWNMFDLVSNLFNARLKGCWSWFSNIFKSLHTWVNSLLFAARISPANTVCSGFLTRVSIIWIVYSAMHIQSMNRQTLHWWWLNTQSANTQMLSSFNFHGADITSNKTDFSGLALSYRGQEAGANPMHIHFLNLVCFHHWNAGMYF